MKLSIRNFQSLGAVDLDVEGLTVLVGKSNTGKSAIVRALQGALFNWPGKEFVRVGAKNAVVAIDGLPVATGDPLNIAWTKGAKNAYTVNGAAFSNVGTGTPPALEAAGYKDIWIGDEDRKKGEAIRPQVAAQHDPLFLLTRSGGFVADVLSTVSRIAQLMTAQGRCETDLKKAKQGAGMARTSRETVLAQQAALDGLDPLVDGVERLGQRVAQTRALEQRIARLRALRERYARLQRFQTVTTGITLPTVAVDYMAVREAVDRLQRLQALATRATRLKPMQGLTLPEPPAMPTLPTQVLVLRQLAPRYARLRQMAGLMLPPETPVPWDALDKARTLFQTMQRHAQHFARLLETTRRCQMAATSTASEVEEVEAKLATTLAALKVCPVCERPMERAG